ncbi:MAG: hypothetical protein P1P84_02800 [Deferrisomatales bacterium]|nr:hypothetical protein [Deferrisomatales bacterium]
MTFDELCKRAEKSSFGDDWMDAALAGKEEIERLREELDKHKHHHVAVTETMARARDAADAEVERLREELALETEGHRTANELWHNARKRAERAERVVEELEERSRKQAQEIHRLTEEMVRVQEKLLESMEEAMVEGEHAKRLRQQLVSLGLDVPLSGL